MKIWALIRKELNSETQNGDILLNSGEDDICETPSHAVNPLEVEVAFLPRDKEIRHPCFKSVIIRNHERQ